MAKKIAAGASFIQTQYCFDVPRLRTFMEQAVDMGLHEKAFILVGVGPLRSDKAAEFMRTKVPGVHIPDAVVARLAGVAPKQKAEEGKRICTEIIQQVREIPGVAGVHIMAYRQEEAVAEIVHRAGLFPRHAVGAQREGHVNPRVAASGNGAHGADVAVHRPGAEQ
jgi:methylenetetrahydrofolate reductase (NADPH)